MIKKDTRLSPDFAGGERFQDIGFDCICPPIDRLDREYGLRNMVNNDEQLLTGFSAGSGIGSWGSAWLWVSS